MAPKYLLKNISKLARPLVLNTHIVSFMYVSLTHVPQSRFVTFYFLLWPSNLTGQSLCMLDFFLKHTLHKQRQTTNI